LEEQKPSRGSAIDAARGVEKLATDLSFLNIMSEDSNQSARFSIWKAHESVLLFGCDIFEWTGYAFTARETRTGSDENESESENGDTVDSEEEDDDDEDDGEDSMPNEDIFASGGSDHDDYHVLDAKAPILDPRRYFLRTMAMRVKVIQDQYIYLIRTLDSGVNNWVSLFQH
jgi:hypothetical protein